MNNHNLFLQTPFAPFLASNLSPSVRFLPPFCPRLPPILRPSKRVNRKRGPGGGRWRKLFASQEMLLMLVYLYHNVCHDVIGQMFLVSADISENSFYNVVQVLRDVCPAYRFDAQKKWTKKKLSWHPETIDVVLLESFEMPIARPSLSAVQKQL